MLSSESTIDLHRLNTISFNVDDCSQPWTLYDEQWNVEEQKWEWTVQRVIAYDTDYDLASFTILPEGVTAEEMIASSPTWQKAMESVRVNSHSVPVLAVNHLAEPLNVTYKTFLFSTTLPFSGYTQGFHMGIIM